MAVYDLVPSEPTERAGVPNTYRFGPYLLDVPRRMLICGPTERPLPEKLCALLLLLLEAGGGVVRKDTLFAELWGDGSASDANLAQHVFMLRGILGERAKDHAYIVTVPGQGYRFAATIERKVGLQMRGTCERCDCALGADEAAYICSYECTYCRACYEALGACCTNCGGELQMRPRRP